MERRYLELVELGLTLDLRGMQLPQGAIAGRSVLLDEALAAMAELEAGAVANPDEGRQVGHYWLRAPELAPGPEMGAAVTGALSAVHAFVERCDGRFETVLVVGIGGSALGPMLLVDALAPASGRRAIAFLDNTDPEGFARVLGGLDLSETLVLVISKSGGTVETRNGLLATQAAFSAEGLDFASHAVAVTGSGSALDTVAVAEGWLARFPMWDWVGGRTSLTGAVGLLPAALVGVDVDGFLAGARAMDAATRGATPEDNPAALMALAWHDATEAKGERAMVVLPYKDRLSLLARYLQQLIMESIGKATDLRGEAVHQGLTVYGNKGSTDQHAYIQQLREGPDDFFAVFVEVLEEGCTDLEVEPGVTAGDYLSGFLAGTRSALAEVGKRSMTLTLERLDARALGALVALHERAVGLYASLVGINAYHQPGVEAGKKAAAALIDLQGRLLALLKKGTTGTAGELAASAGAPEGDVFHVLRHLSASGRVQASGTGLERVFSQATAR